MHYTHEELAEALWVQEKTEIARPSSDHPWTNYGLFLSREEYRGYLRGRAVELLREGHRTGYEEALRCVDKLIELEAGG